MPNISYFCEEHKQEWFKTPKMRAYAHPVKDEYDEPVLGENGKPLWCNMIKTKPKSVPQRPPPAAQVWGSGIGPNGPPEPLRSQSVMSKNDWAEKDRITRQSIHRQSASQRGVELVLGGTITFNQMPPWIKAFETYYDTGEWTVRPLTGHEELAKPASATPPVVSAAPDVPVHVYPLCPIHKMPLDKQKAGAPAHYFTDASGAKHQCIPKLDPAICAKHNVTMRQDAQGNYYHAVDEDSPEPEICKGK